MARHDPLFISQDEIFIDFPLAGAIIPEARGMAIAPADPDSLTLWDYAHYLAASNWLTHYSPAPGTSNLEQVRGYLEAAYHLVEAEAWGAAAAIATQVIAGTHPLCLQLGKWGYIQDQLDLCQRLLHRVDDKTNALCFAGLGHSFYELGEAQQAITYHQQQLELALADEDDELAAIAWEGLGLAHHSMGQLLEAIACAQQQLDIAHRLNCPTLEIAALDRFGLYQKDQGNFPVAQQALHQAEQLAAKLDAIEQQEQLCGALSSLYLEAGNYRQAIVYAQRQLSLLEASNNRGRLHFGLITLGIIYFFQSQPILAQPLMEQALQLSTEQNNLRLMAVASYYLACIYSHQLKDYSGALHHFKAAFQFHQKLGHGRNQVMTAANLAHCYGCLGHMDRAYHHINQAMALAKTDGSADSQGVCLMVQASLCWRQRQFIQALGWALRAITVAPPWKSSSGRLIARRFMDTLKEALKPVRPFPGKG
jgi:tetratricopeptide (TPR) repeat protein